MELRALILSGGHGTRLRPLTYSQQKQLIPVANRPILFYAIDDCVNAGARDVGIIVGPNREQVEGAVRDAQAAGEWPEARFAFIHQPEPLGLAHAVKTATDAGFLDDQSPFVMYLGDNLLSGGIRPFADEFRDLLTQHGGRMGASILLCPVPDPTKFGVATVDAQGRIVRLVEKPKRPESNLAVIGVYFFTPQVHEGIRQLKPSWRGELEIVDAIQWLLDQGRVVHAQQVRGWWKDTGGAVDILGANRIVLDELPPDASLPGDGVKGQLTGRVRIGKGAHIDEASVVKGPAVIGEGARLIRSYVGPYTSVGPRCIIQDAEVEDSILLEECNIEGVHGIRESILGRRVRIRRSDGRPRGVRLVLGDECYLEV